MPEWETEDEYAEAAHTSLPPPNDTPYRTPSGSSKRSSRQKSISPGPSSSPPGDRNGRGSNDVANDESISILDPRRFTPTLHANLVSEILSLRRDQDEKTKIIEELETALHDSRGEQEQLEATLALTGKESRSLKRQLALLEGGTSSALSELARERDEAVDVTNDVKRRLETAQKKVRSQEEDADRVHVLWARDKDKWEESKRNFERRVHVAESRLKTVLDEVAAYQTIHQNGQQMESEADEMPRDHVHAHGSDTASVRTMSITNSIRFSMTNGHNGYGSTKLNGVSLADELDLDEDEDPQTDHDGRESVLSARHRRNQSRDSVMFQNHRRTKSIESLMRPGSVARGKLLANQALLDRMEGGIMERDETIAPTKAVYVDSGVQYSPPPSPQLSAIEPPTTVRPFSVNGSRNEKQSDLDNAPREWEIEANQRRKRVHATPPLIISAPIDGSMVSAASQTLEDPLSPPRTPISPTRGILKGQVREMISMSTQTEEVPELQSPRRSSPQPIQIPSIQLHPPNSAPATPNVHFLPQHFKDAACQVHMHSSVPSRSVSMQTEEIRVDMRINQLPRHLQPSTISSKPPSPEPTVSESKQFSPVPGNVPSRNPRRIKSRPSLEKVVVSPSPPQFSAANARDAYPGNNDDGPVSRGKDSIRRPHRVSSLFAGFDNVSSDDGDDFADADLSDNDYRTALSAPKPHSSTNATNKRILSPTTAPGHKILGEAFIPPVKNAIRQTSNSSSDYHLPEEQALPHKFSMKPGFRQLDKPLPVAPKQSTMRRAAMIQSGVAAHQVRSRSPSFPDPLQGEPPFPIPTRASSRQPPGSISAPSDGNRSPTWGKGSSRGHVRTNSIRKVRSAAALPRGGRSYRRRGSRSPPPMSASTEAPESPKLPPMPHNEITSATYAKNTDSGRNRHQQQPSVNTAVTAATTGSVGSTGQTTSVVDAIAQTMVGEWMFKYVRRRKSFGVPESNAQDVDGVNGVRHKRWVWLAPYERAVMWSSKQPTSGPALLGKSGRKLTISSVLDVKDENPSPKGIQPLFNRSILILTPARALKFTATTPERHYVWLTALSFLAHSSQAVPEIVAAPLPVQQPNIPEFEIPPQGGRLRKNPIRDSIRVAKGKTAIARPGPTSVHSSQRGDTSHSVQEAESFYTTYTDPADAPVVPRFSDRAIQIPQSHGRKRSNTGSRIPPPLSFRGFSGTSGGGHIPTSSTAGLSVGTTGSSDIYQSQPSSSVAGYNGMAVSGRSSVRTSDASARPGAVLNNFFDAVGTMRMEAFISPMSTTNQFADFPDEHDEMNMIGMQRRRSSREMRYKSRDRDVYYPSRGRVSDDWYGGNKTAGEEDYGHDGGGGGGYGHDPFHGF